MPGADVRVGSGRALSGFSAGYSVRNSGKTAESHVGNPYVTSGFFSIDFRRESLKVPLKRPCHVTGDRDPSSFVACPFAESPGLGRGFDGFRGSGIGAGWLRRRLRAAFRAFGDAAPLLMSRGVDRWPLGFGLWASGCRAAVAQGRPHNRSRSVPWPVTSTAMRPFTVSATASSGLAVTFSTVATRLASALRAGPTARRSHIMGSGTCTVQADQAGNDTYAAAPSVDQSFSVTAAVDADLGVEHSGTGGRAGRRELRTELLVRRERDDLSDVGFADDLHGHRRKHRLFPGCRDLQTDGTGHGNRSISGCDWFDPDLHGLESGAPKCTKSWAKAVSGNWSNASDWSPAGVPTSNDNVCIAVGTANYTVTVDTSSSVASLSVGGTAKTETLDIPAGSSVSVSGNVAITSHGALSRWRQTETTLTSDLDGGVLTNAGSVTVGSGGGFAQIQDRLRSRTTDRWRSMAPCTTPACTW